MSKLTELTVTDLLESFAATGSHARWRICGRAGRARSAPRCS